MRGGNVSTHHGYRVIYREAHTLLEEIAEASLDGTRKNVLADLATVPLLIVDDLGVRKLPHTAAEDLLELIMRRQERASTMLTSNRPSMTGANASATPPPSPPSSIACSITTTSSSAGPEAGGRNFTPTCARRPPRSRTHQSRSPSVNGRFLNCRSMARFEVSTEVAGRAHPETRNRSSAQHARS